MHSISVVQGDITTLNVDAIVNAANERMLGGGGVDGAVHRAAGGELYEACLAIPEVRPGVRCPTGSCEITPGFALPARFIIHAVGPIWRGGGSGEEDLLRSCYRRAIELALRHELTSIAFPAISCGIYGYPPADAIRVSIEEIKSTLGAIDKPISVTLVAFSDELAEAMQTELNRQDE